MLKLTKAQAKAFGVGGKKQSKYRAVRTTIDGVTFASKREAKRFCELKAMQQAGEISDLELQPVFPIKVNGVLACKYVADFRYRKHAQTTIVVEDVKGMKTPVYRLKKKLVEAIYGIEIVEV